MAGRIGYNGADKWKIKATELLNEGGGGGTDDYNDLENKPSINNVELSGNKTSAELGINIPTNTSDLTNDSGFITKSADDLENYYKKAETYEKISYVDISEYPYGGTGHYSGVIKIDEDYQTGDTREYMALWPDGIKLNFVYQDPDNPMVQRIVRNQLVSNFELWSLHGISKNIQDQIDALPTSDTTYTFSVGDSNGEIKVTPSSGSAYNVSVKGLGSAAYADTSAFQAPITGGATTIVSSDLTASRALISNSSGKVAVSAVTSTELGYLDGVTSAIQTQLDGKVATTDTIAIAHGGTGATTRLNALKALTNENVSTNATYFLTITDSWGKGGYTSVANAKTVLGLGSAAYETADTASTANTVVKRTANKYVYASYFNTSAGSQDPASYTSYPAFISSDGFLRRSTVANFKALLGIDNSTYTYSGDKTISNSSGESSFTTLKSVSCSAGTWLIIGIVQFQGGTNLGWRKVGISSSTEISSLAGSYAPKTNSNNYQNVTAIYLGTFPSTQTVKLNTMFTASSTTSISVYYWYYLVKLK